MKNRIEIEEAENGYTIRVWKEEEKDDFGYREPKVLIASTTEEIVKIINENLKTKGN